MTEQIVLNRSEYQRPDGYVNATKLCQSAGKLWSNYAQLQGTQKYVEALVASLGIPSDRLIDQNPNAPSNDRHTWIHPELAIHLASWVSIEYQIQVARWAATALAEEQFTQLSSVMRSPISGFVYLARSGKGWYKVGFSKEPYKRMTALQVATPLEVVLIHRVFSFDAPSLERRLHEYFNAYWLRGEWFELPSDLVAQFPLIAAELDGEIELFRLSDKSPSLTR